MVTLMLGSWPLAQMAAGLLPVLLVAGAAVFLGARALGRDGRRRRKDAGGPAAAAETGEGAGSAAADFSPEGLRAAFPFSPETPGPDTHDRHRLVPGGFDWSLAPPAGERAGPPGSARAALVAAAAEGVAVAPVRPAQSLAEWRAARRPAAEAAEPTYVARRAAAAQAEWGEYDSSGEVAERPGAELGGGLGEGAADAGAADRASVDAAHGTDDGVTAQAPAAAMPAASEGPADAVSEPAPADAREVLPDAGAAAGTQEASASAAVSPGPSQPDPVDAFLAAIAARFAQDGDHDAASGAVAEPALDAGAREVALSPSPVQDVAEEDAGTDGGPVAGVAEAHAAEAPPAPEPPAADAPAPEPTASEPTAPDALGGFRAAFAELMARQEAARAATAAAADDRSSEPAEEEPRTAVAEAPEIGAEAGPAIEGPSGPAVLSDAAEAPAATEAPTGEVAGPAELSVAADAIPEVGSREGAGDAAWMWSGDAWPAEAVAQGSAGPAGPGAEALPGAEPGEVPEATGTDRADGIPGEAVEGEPGRAIAEGVAPDGAEAVEAAQEAELRPAAPVGGLAEAGSEAAHDAEPPLQAKPPEPADGPGTAEAGEPTPPPVAGAADGAASAPGSAAPDAATAPRAAADGPAVTASAARPMPSVLPEELAGLVARLERHDAAVPSPARGIHSPLQKTTGGPVHGPVHGPVSVAAMLAERRARIKQRQLVPDDHDSPAG
jgi:hypothetical protein